MSSLQLAIETASLIRNEASRLRADAFSKENPEKYWQWKHENNPFGKSIIVVARRNYQIIGLRPLMMSGLRYKDMQIRAVQCVDSAVIESERRKGVFRKLCMEALSALDDTVVFNTPNQVSFPAYMKMGWHNVGGLVRVLLPLSLTAMIKYVINRYLPITTRSANADASNLAHHPSISESFPTGFERLIEEHGKSLRDKITIDESRDWLKWRINTPDNIRCMFYYPRDSIFLIFYLLKINGFTGIRVMDIIADFNQKKAFENEMNNFIKIIKKRFDFILIACSEAHPFLGYLNRFRTARRESMNFVVNVSRVTHHDKSIFLNPHNWALMQSAFDYN